MNEPIISVSGLRGIVGRSLDPLTAIRYTAAFVEGLPDGPIVLTRDGRATGAMLVDAIRSAICGLGRQVLDGEIAATPTTGVLVRQHQAAGGIQVSASHNPPEYNGLKLFSEAGRVIDAEAGRDVLKRYRTGHFSWRTHDSIGRAEILEDTTSRHLSLVLATIDIDRIRNRQFRVLLDSNHGAGSILGRRLLEVLGCKVTVLGDRADGDFAHAAEPTAENLAGVLARVKEAGADVGFCQDPDADRLAVIDENARYVGEEYTLALCLDHVLRERKGPIVTNCATSRMSEDLANRYGAAFHRSAVGEANVTAVMTSVNAVFGGEGNGGPIDPRVGYVRDSFVGMALILDAMAARELPLSQMADELPRYTIVKTKFPLLIDQLPSVEELLRNRFADAEVDRQDGLRLDWPGRWLLIRPSNTEPIVRVIAEAETEAAASQLCDSAGKLIQNFAKPEC
ncbi:MAG: phosphoglucosamine mutase [Planctomycetes bacterium]|nr:phosphoglucosamine mutase [Planctomycetota bacterium]